MGMIKKGRCFKAYIVAKNVRIMQEHIPLRFCGGVTQHITNLRGGC